MSDLRLFNIELERSTFLDELHSKLSRDSDFFNDRGEASHGRRFLNAQAKRLQILIRRNAPKSTGRYLSRALTVQAVYTDVKPYGSIRITALTKGAKQYWIQREARDGLIVDKRQFRATIRGRKGKRWMYIPVQGTRVWRFSQGYDYRKVGEGAKELIKKAGYPFSRFVKNPSDHTVGFVWGYRNAQDYKRRRYNFVNRTLLYVARKQVDQPRFEKGRYIGPSIEQQMPDLEEKFGYHWERWANRQRIKLRKVR